MLDILLNPYRPRRLDAPPELPIPLLLLLLPHSLFFAIAFTQPPPLLDRTPLLSIPVTGAGQHGVIALVGCGQRARRTRGGVPRWIGSGRGGSGSGSGSSWARRSSVGLAVPMCIARMRICTLPRTTVPLGTGGGVHTPPPRRSRRVIPRVRQEKRARGSRRIIQPQLNSQQLILLLLVRQRVLRLCELPVRSPGRHGSPLLSSRASGRRGAGELVCGGEVAKVGVV